MVLRTAYQRLTASTIPQSEARLESSMRQLLVIRERLAAIHAKYEAARPISPDGEAAPS